MMHAPTPSAPTKHTRKPIQPRAHPPRNPHPLRSQLWRLHIKRHKPRRAGLPKRSMQRRVRRVLVRVPSMAPTMSPTTMPAVMSPPMAAMPMPAALAAPRAGVVPPLGPPRQRAAERGRVGIDGVGVAAVGAEDELAVEAGHAVGGGAEGHGEGVGGEERLWGCVLVVPVVGEGAGRDGRER
jgi:hypothetical protein